MTRADRTRRSPRRTQPAARRRPTTPYLAGGAIAVVIIAAIAAVALANPGTSGPPEPVTRPVQVAGSQLPELTDPAADLAIGLALPTLGGVGLDGQPLEIGPGDGPLAIAVLAHWCPHCRAELPRLVDVIAQGGVPAGVSVVGLSTAIDPARPNYAPSAWLEREGWTRPTLIDDASNTALQALGIGNFPGFVFVDANGRVVRRLTGEIGADQFVELLASIAP